MLKHALSFPDEFISLTQNAKQNNRIHLAWRLFAIARVIKTCTERKISDAGIEAENILKDICQVNFEPQKKRKIGRNEKCPCGSGQKYKKCCGK
jgi:uncharacterized protein YecA (UPF0149 family)